MRLGRLLAVRLFFFYETKTRRQFLSQPARLQTTTLCYNEGLGADDTLVYRGSRLRRSRTCFSRAVTLQRN